MPFCHNCGAPQIRVAIASEELDTPSAPGMSDEEPPTAEASAAQRANAIFRQAEASQAAKYERRVVIFSALAAGFAAGIGSLIQYEPLITIPLCMVAAGGIAITLYKRRMPDASVPPRRGFRIGALAGFFGFLLNATVGVISLLSAEYRTALRHTLQEQFKSPVGQFRSVGAADGEEFRRYGLHSDWTGQLVCSLVVPRWLILCLPERNWGRNRRRLVRQEDETLRAAPLRWRSAVPSRAITVKYLLERCHPEAERSGAEGSALLTKPKADASLRSA